MNNNFDHEIEKEIWDDELNRIKQQRTKRFKRALMVVLLVVWTSVVFVFGYALTLLDKTPFGDENISKFERIKKVLEDDWYFANQVEDIDQALIDQALYGMSSSELDPYTSYMSNDEINSFQTSINKGFVGIGVQYIGGDSLNIITKVFKDSPAQKAGVLEGDIINKVDDVLVKDLTTDEIADRVKGEEGSIVKVEFIRNGEAITIEIKRGAVNNNTYGYLVDDHTGYVQLFSFGNTTASELKNYLESFIESGANQIIIDVRDNGGGYLDSLVDVASLFLDKGVVCMIEEYADGSKDIWKTNGGKIEGFEEIVILINGNSASASEVFAIAMKEQRENVTLIGETTFGKGTVQNTKSFADGSALKYTAGRWLSPNGVWVHKEGIAPDIEAATPNIMAMPLYKMEEDTIVGLDEVSLYVAAVQEALEFLGYEGIRKDGYLDEMTYDALQQLIIDYKLETTDILSDELYSAIISIAQREWATVREKDTQLGAALAFLNQ